MSITLALLAALTYGASDFLGGLAARRTAALAVSVSAQAVGLGALLLALLVLPASPTAGDLAWGAGAGLAGGTGLVLFYRALAQGRMGVVAPLTAVGAAALPVGAGLLLGERLSALGVAGVALALVAVVMVSRSGGDPAGTARRGVATALLAGVGFGVFYVGIEHADTAAGLWPLAAARVASVTLLLSGAALTGRSLALPRPMVPAVVAAGMGDMAANVLFLLAVRDAPLSLVAVLVGLYPVATVLLARAVLHERLRPVQTAGLVTATSAIALLGVA